MMMMDMGDHLTAQQAADRLDYTVQHVRRLLREGRLEGTKVGRDWVVEESKVREFAGQRANIELPLGD